MAWATNYIKKLRDGETVSFRPRGQSIAGRIDSGQLVTVEPAIASEVKVGEIVLSIVHGVQYLHLVKQVGERGVLIGNNRGRINGWTKHVVGRVVRIE
jgi:hypothetical protein